MTGMRIGRGCAVSGVAAHIVSGVRVGLSRSHGVARVGICRSSVVSSVAAHIVPSVRVGLSRLSRSHIVACMGIGRSGGVAGMAAHVVSSMRAGGGRLGWSHIVTRMGIGRSSAVSSVAAHIMTGMRVSLSAGSGAMHRAGLTVAHHGAVTRGLGGRRRRLGGGSMSRMTRMALGQGGAACGQHQGGERQGEGKGLHEAAPASGRTVTTLNMPACMCIRR